MADATVRIANTSDVQQQILAFIKQQRETTTAAIAKHLNVTYEAVRQQLRQLESGQLVISYKQRDENQRKGRPTQYYTLSAAAEHLFPKAYDELAVELIDRVAATLGPDALREVLASFADANVREWKPRLQNMSLKERLEALKSVYFEDDAFMQVAIDESSDEIRLIERNCPFLNVASRRPALCSVTVSTLSQLLGYRVVREKRFQNGDGRCVFRVCLDKPIDAEAAVFVFEDEVED